MAKFVSAYAKRKHWERLRQRIYFFGTPEKRYLDSGLFLYARYVRTKDEHDPMGSIKGKLLPRDASGRLKEYILQTLWHMLNSNHLCVTKSRQIMLSWLICLYVDWVSQTMPHQLTLIQSKEKEAAKNLVSQGIQNPSSGRISFIHHHLPPWLQDQRILKRAGNKAGHLTYTSGSQVHAAAQGEGQARSYTLTRLIMDEMAFQDQAEGAYGAGLPAVKGGGQFMGVSTAAPGFFRDLCLNIAGGLNDVDVPNEHLWLPPGMKKYTTRDKVDVVRIHYSADPDKNLSTETGAAWYQMIAEGYVGGIHNPGFKREMEIEWDIMGGKPVYAHLYRHDSPVFRPLPPPELIAGMEIRAGLDHGTTSESAFEVWGRDSNGKGWSLFEIYGVMSVVEMADAIKECPYYDRIISWRADPSIWKKDQSGGDSAYAIADLYERENLHFEPGYRGADIVLYEQMRSFDWSNPEDPDFYITPATPVLKQQFSNARWEEHTSAKAVMFKNDLARMVNKDNHSTDAFAYSKTRTERTSTVSSRIILHPWSVGALDEELDSLDRPSGGYCGGL
jgi:hypothetical protein